MTKDWKDVLEPDKGMLKHVSKKKAEDIVQSRIDAQNVKSKYGGIVPESIIKADFSKRQKDVFLGKRSANKILDSYPSGVFGIRVGQLDRSRGTEMKSCPELGPTSRGLKRVKGKKMTISRFPWNVGETVIRLYSNEYDWILDPFAGHNSRFQIAFENFRNYVGFDISAEFMQYNRLILDELYKQQTINDKKLPEIKLHEMDSRKINEVIEPNSFDFCFTSPPYYDMEYYGPEAEQLSECKSYEDFLKDMYKIIENCYIGLKKGSYIVFFVNDFRRNKKLHLYHMHIAQLFEKVGFTLWDIIVVDLGISIRRCFPNQFEQYKIFPKRHEYGIIGLKE